MSAGTSPGTSPAVAVLVVTHDSADDLPGCLEAVATLRHRPLELVVVDCASADDSVAIARAAALPEVATTVVALAENLGFAGGMNRALAATAAPYVLSLNPDARPAPDYLERLLVHLADPTRRVGAATGRLLRPAAGGERRLDACGMRLTRTWRHLDRGSGELDRGQYARAERVFGATGAASAFARRALDDVAIGGEVFDVAFHSYREDAELCFRLQERGWDVVYEPTARCEHRRRVVPAGRRGLPAAINLHSLKNRYLLRAAHQGAGNLLRTLVPTTLRDLQALAYVLLRERGSLAAYRWLWRHRREIVARRRAVRGRITHPAAVERWFAVDALPLDGPVERR